MSLYSRSRQFLLVTAVWSSVAMPSISARCAASLSRGLQRTMPSWFRACRARFCLLSCDTLESPLDVCDGLLNALSLVAQKHLDWREAVNLLSLSSLTPDYCLVPLSGQSMKGPRVDFPQEG